jgi:hypothetical protein
MAHTIWHGVVRRARAVGRRLTPPGNRTPLDESLSQRPGLGSAEVPPSAAGTTSHIQGGWMGGA